ncbi:MAG: S8 family serine peptidase, partial [Nitriliruptoraceae bacterium]
VEADQPVWALEEVPSGVARIDAPTAHGQGYDGEGVKVAILDTGIDPDHLALDVDTSLGVNCVDEDGEPTDGSTDDGHGHGTHVAGTTSASIDDGDFVGAATAAEVVPVKVLGDDGSGSFESIICGIDHVTANAATISLANMSLGGSGEAGESCTSTTLREAICASVDEGVTYTVAAGNDGSDASGFVPAAYPEVITVSALDEERSARVTGGGPPRTETGEGLASFSNHGEAVDVIAPGVDIDSTLAGGGYGEKSGTSMAAPHVAGVAALMIATNPDLSPAQVEATLQSTGECPDGVENGASGACADQGEWLGDPDGIAEPLINAPRAAAAAGDPPEPSYTEPVAEFSYACTDLECDFSDESTVDDDLEVDSYQWDFGDETGSSNEENPSYTYEEGGTYTVELTVTDSDAKSDSTTQGITVESSEDDSGDDPEAGISLEVNGYKVRGLHKADLSWAENEGNVDIVRDGVQIADGVSDQEQSYTDHIDERGGASYTYQVCETVDGDEVGDECSNKVTIEF